MRRTIATPTAGLGIVSVLALAAAVQSQPAATGPKHPSFGFFSWHASGRFRIILPPR